MLLDRGYTLTQDIDSIVEDVYSPIEAHKEHTTFSIYFLLNNRPVPSLKEFIAQNEVSPNDPSKKYCVVTKSSVNKTFKTLCNDLDIEHFAIQSLGVNITRHTLVPKHTLIQQDSSDEYLKKLKQSLCLQSLNQLPIMKATDPVAKYYAASPGDVFKIERYSKTAGQYTSFRYVVE